MERFDRQKALDLMNKTREEDKIYQGTLDKIYLTIKHGAEKGYGAAAYGPLSYSMATQAASFLEEKNFVTVIRCVPGGYELEVIWEDVH